MEAGDTRARIREVAVELFTAHGYEQTSLREIADRVGITKASLYYHYPSKQDLLLAVLQPLVVEWRAAVAAAESLPHTPANVRLALENCLDTMLRHRSACALFIRDTAAILTAVQPLWAELIELSTRLHTWLAGPAPTSADRIRAVAATETLGVALTSSALMPDVAEAELRQTLLECAAAVLGLRRVRPRPAAARSA